MAILACIRQLQGGGYPGNDHGRGRPIPTTAVPIRVQPTTDQDYSAPTHGRPDYGPPDYSPLRAGRGQLRARRAAATTTTRGRPRWRRVSYGGFLQQANTFRPPAVP